MFQSADEPVHISASLADYFDNDLSTAPTPEGRLRSLLHAHWTLQERMVDAQSRLGKFDPEVESTIDAVEASRQEIDRFCNELQSLGYDPRALRADITLHDLATPVTAAA